MQQTTTPSTATDELGRNYEALHRLQGSLTRMYVQLTNLGGFSTTTDAALLRVLQRMSSDLLRFLVQAQGALIRPQTMFYFRYTYARRTRERKGDVTHSSILGRPCLLQNIQLLWQVEVSHASFWVQFSAAIVRINSRAVDAKVSIHSVAKWQQQVMSCGNLVVMSLLALACFFQNS